MKSDTAIVVMTKTPGFSPIKTRLGCSDLGFQFFLRSSRAVQGVLRSFAKTHGAVDLFLSVAERPAMVLCPPKGFSSFWQGEGDLGDRIDQTYSHFSKVYKKVVLLGMDSPQVSLDILGQSLDKLNSSDWVFGPALDGGFYLLAGRREIPSQVWRDTPMSSSQTLQHGFKALEALGTVDLLQPRVDVDTVGDFFDLQKELRGLPQLIPEQTDLLRWVDEYLRESVLRGSIEI